MELLFIIFVVPVFVLMIAYGIHDGYMEWHGVQVRKLMKR